MIWQMRLILKTNELQITEAYIKENPTLMLNDDLKAFKFFDSMGKPEKYFKKTKYGRDYVFTNPKGTNAAGGQSLSFWRAAYSNEKINGYSFKANVSKTETDIYGNPKISSGNKSRIEYSDYYNPKVIK